MKIENLLNDERVNSLRFDKNAYIQKQEKQKECTSCGNAEKVIFPQPYENANNYYNKNQFNCCDNSNEKESKQDCDCKCKNNSFHKGSGFNIQSLLPMLMGGKFNDMLNPVMSLLGQSKGGGMDFAKIFELFKPKSKVKKEDEKEDDKSSKFEDFIIIED